jgi:hypothetical protein
MDEARLRAQITALAFEVEVLRRKVEVLAATLEFLIAADRAAGSIASAPANTPPPPRSPP